MREISGSLYSNLCELRRRRRADAPDFINRHSGKQLCPHLAGTKIADAEILRTLLCDEIGDLGERLCWGDAYARWDKRVEIDSPDLIRLRELSRFQDELKIELRRVTNRLWQQLHRYYPQMLAISPAADERLMWDLLEAAPTPAEGRKMSSLRVQRILKAHRIRKLSVEDVHLALRTGPLVLAPGAAEAASEHVHFLVPQVKLLEEQLREVSNRIKYLLTAMIEANAGAEQPTCDADLVLSIPGIGLLSQQLF